MRTSTKKFNKKYKWSADIADKIICKVYLTMTCPLECLTIKYQLIKRMQSNNTSFSLPVKIQKNIAALEDREKFLTKLRLILYISVIVLIDIYSTDFKKLCPHAKVYMIFLHNCPKLASTKYLSVIKWINNDTSI